RHQEQQRNGRRRASGEGRCVDPLPADHSCVWIQRAQSHDQCLAQGGGDGMVMLRHLWRDERAASAAEFGLIVPILTLLLFSVIDAGRFMWEYNRAEKATQAGAR